ncbi:MAG: hypothetical protein MASP_01767 [Candidatus Methanolliviera sp. GoM_asphalt]|nr:MAG: hypothetical protein MASP_01767 [Candidatus Methanolliviera sp. GoM_asphalt]
MPLGNIRHIIFSPSQREAKELMKTKKGFKRLKKEALKVIKSSGITGGLITFHAERHNEAGWYSSPHFHVLGYGYLKDARTFHKDTNWIYKNKGVRESVYSTIQYLLSHAGIAREQDSDDNKRPFQVVNWFGALSYYYVSRAEEIKKELTYPCKVCGAPLHQFTNVDEGDEDEPINWSDAVDEGAYMVQIKEHRYELQHLKQLRARYEVGRDGFLRHRVQTREGRKRRKARKDIVDKFGRLKSG